MSAFSQPLSIQQGVVQVNGQPRLIVSADYPYYRDPREVWRDRLQTLQALGVTIVTAYIPWRHHQTASDAAPDFAGRTQPNRDVVGFLALCQELGLAVVAKPGPFIHAETNYGGLPDWVCPLNNPAIEALLDAGGEPVRWSGARPAADGRGVESWPLPAPLSPPFVEQVQAWMAHVNARVIGPAQSPAGPIVAVQVANEGLYSNGQHAPWAFDYSASGLQAFRRHLQAEYGSLAEYNRHNGAAHATWDAILAPTTWRDTGQPTAWRAFLDWGRFLPRYFDQVVAEWARPLQLRVPLVANQNPPLDAPFGLDAWLTRVEPERWPSVHYGFTNWVGDVSANAWAFDRYRLTPKRFPGANWEENWGFAELYDPAYIDAATSFFQTLVILNAGATGFNIYTGAATGGLDTNLEVFPKAPYPDAAPIDERGQLTPKAEIARWLIAFMARHGTEFLACRSEQPVAWGLYLPHAHLAAWVPDAAAAPHLPAVGRHLRQFLAETRALHVDYGLVNLETAAPADLHRYPRLVVSGGAFMARAVQAKLADYVRGGGRLLMTGSLPNLDEAFQPWGELARLQPAVPVAPELALADWLADVDRPRVRAGQADVWVRTHPDRDVHFVTVLIPAQGATEVEVEFRAGSRRHTLALTAAQSGGALLRLETGRVTAALLKGHNQYRGSSVAPGCRLDDQVIGADTPGDFAWIGDWRAHLPAGQGAAALREIKA